MEFLLEVLSPFFNISGIVFELYKHPQPFALLFAAGMAVLLLAEKEGEVIGKGD